MARGDQIYVMRDLEGIPGRYQHHGIDCGDGTVIHYSKASGDAVVTRTTWQQFSWGRPVRIKSQNLAFVPEVVIQRAEGRLGERKYDLFLNNCEHFASWCKTGKSRSAQLAGFGFNLDRLSQGPLRQLIQETTASRSPQQAMALLQAAIADVAMAYETLLRQQQQAAAEVESWHRVAETALGRQREDLARAALHRKRSARQRQQQLEQHLQELVDVQLSLQRSRETSARRLVQED